MEERGIDVGGVVKDVIDERQDEQNLELGGGFDRQARTDVACPMQQDRKDDGRGDNACHVVRDLRVGGGERGDAHPVAELAAQISTGDAQHNEQRAQAIARAQIDDERQMHDEWIYLTGEKLAADGIGEAECASGYGADHHQLKRMTPVDLDTAERRRGKNAKKQGCCVVNCPKYHLGRGEH